MQKNHLKMKELSAEERPYEKFLKYGASFLTDAELLAVIIRVGTKEQHVLDMVKSIFCQAGEDAGLAELSALSMEELMKVPGIGRVKAIQIKCVFELGIRLAKQEKRDRVRFHHPQSPKSVLIF